MAAQLTPDPQGRWTVGDHRPRPFGELWCRGNVGEVFPNVMTPMSSSLYMGSVAAGQARAAHQLGMVTTAQLKDFDPEAAWSTGVFGGYLYGNVTLARTATARTPGLTAEMVDEQMFGLHDAPTQAAPKGSLELAAIGRTMKLALGALRRADDADLRRDQREIAAYTSQHPDPAGAAGASTADLLATARSLGPWADRMMYELLLRSARAGVARAAVERLVAKVGDADLVNRLTAGIGNIESAEPALDLWRLGRLVAADRTLTTVFDAGVEGLEGRLRATGAAAPFVTEFEAFRSRHGARGPDEWELCSPTWASDPAIALVMIERLRSAPPERDPVAVATRLAAERAELVPEVRRQVPLPARRLFDAALRSGAAYALQREATKAAFMRATLPARTALAELARRYGQGHHTFFLLRIEEVEAAMADPASFTGTLAERRQRRDFLQERMPPFWFEGELPDPATWPLRAERRRPDSSPRTLTGMAACPGVASGRARVVLDPADPAGLEPGDILVAPLTDPAWTPLFLAAAGVVVDVGAQQSHAVIVARELGIPAVVSATGASTTIPDGAWITVDGSAGTVVVHAADFEHP